MASNRILSDQSTFYEIGSHSIYEETFEKMILKFKEDLFPDHHCFEFKHLLRVPRQTNVKADLILIDREYHEWVIVEVEVARHSWSGHVADQVERLELAEIPRSIVARLWMSEECLSCFRTNSSASWLFAMTLQSGQRNLLRQALSYSSFDLSEMNTTVFFCSPNVSFAAAHDMSSLIFHNPQQHSRVGTKLSHLTQSPLIFQMSR
jgi:hypothetical protein